MSANAALPTGPALSDPDADALCAPWTLFRRPRARAAVRLLCLPFAGGSALAYRQWGGQLPDFIEVCPLQLPGRSNRSHEPPHTRVADLLDELLPAIAPLLRDLPIALFGHSMGAALALAVAAELERQGKAPLRLFASGRLPPLPGSGHALHLCDDAALTAYLRELGGTPEIVFEDPELKAMVFRVLRADLALNGDLDAVRPLRAVPISALGGEHDPRVPPASLPAWSALTSAGFDCRLFPGGHFFCQQHEAEVTRYLGRRLHDDLEKLHVGRH